MAATTMEHTDTRSALAALLKTYSTELTSRDKKSMAAAEEMLRPGSEVFVAALPNDPIDKVVAAVAQLKQGGLIPVPHVVARNVESLKALDELLRRLVGEAGVDRVLTLGGDRDKPVGDLEQSLQIIESGLIQKHGISKIFMACYPEGHPRIPNEKLEAARAAKLAAAAKAGFDVTLVSQFCFDAKPIVQLAERMRSQGVTQPFRVGVAGPADRATLVKYAMMCGVGASLRALKERQDLAKNVMSGETPEALLTEVAEAQARRPELGISGVHFFTFGSLAKSAQFAREHQ